VLDYKSSGFAVALLLLLKHEIFWSLSNENYLKNNEKFDQKEFLKYYSVQSKEGASKLYFSLVFGIDI
jgi:hypothetical protein